MAIAIDWKSYVHTSEYIWNGNSITKWLWCLDSSWRDSSWYSNNGTNNWVTWNKVDWLSYGSFNWTSSFIDIPDSNSLDWINEITLSVFIKPTTLKDSYFLSKDDVTNRSWTFDTTNYTWQLWKLDALFFVWANYSYAYTTNQNIITAWIWQHVWVTRNSAGIIKFYINGNAIPTTQINTQAWAINNSTANMMIWKRNYAPSPWFFDGDMSEVLLDHIIWSDQKFKDYFDYTKQRYWLL